MFRTLAALTLFGVSFGFVEAAVVVYLRVSYEPLHHRLYPERAPSDLFPILRLDQLESAGPEFTARLATELAREAATLVMLAAIAVAVARCFRQWIAAFIVVFGLWDISFYIFLSVLIGWPSSLFDWDLLFLLPLPWVGPVAAPVLVATAMTSAGTVVLARESAARPARLALCHWTAILSGAAIIILAFCWDFRNILAGGLPNPFHWPLFALGLALGLVGFAHGLIMPNAGTCALRGDLAAR